MYLSGMRLVPGSLTPRSLTLHPGIERKYQLLCQVRGCNRTDGKLEARLMKKRFLYG